jgi:hypothetical protein
MDAAIVGVAGTLLGGLVGGLLTHWNSTALAKLEMKWQQVRLRQEKLEEIAEILDQIDYGYKKLFGNVLLRVEIGDPLDSKMERIPNERLRVLMEFYAPTMIENLPALDNAYNLFAKVITEVIPSKTRTQTEKKEITGRALIARSDVSKACRALSEKAALLAHEAVNNDNKKKTKIISLLTSR